MADKEKSEREGQCCTVKVIIDGSDEDCCSEVQGERVVKVVCCPGKKKSEE